MYRRENAPPGLCRRHLLCRRVAPPSSASANSDNARGVRDKGRTRAGAATNDASVRGSESAIFEAGRRAIERRSDHSAANSSQSLIAVTSRCSVLRAFKTEYVSRVLPSRKSSTLIPLVRPTIPVGVWVHVSQSVDSIGGVLCAIAVEFQQKL